MSSPSSPSPPSSSSSSLPSLLPSSLSSSLSPLPTTSTTSTASATTTATTANSYSSLDKEDDCSIVRSMASSLSSSSTSFSNCCFNTTTTEPSVISHLEAETICDMNGRVVSLSLTLANFNDDKTFSIPTILSQLKALSTLNIYGNFSGPIPTEIFNLSSLTNLNISNTAISTHIPSDISLLSNLKELALERNSFTGEIPSEIFQMKAITLITLRSNSLTGSSLALSQPKTVYVFLMELSEITINVDDNYLSGTLPFMQSASLSLGQNCFQNEDIAIPPPPPTTSHHELSQRPSTPARLRLTLNTKPLSGWCVAFCFPYWCVYCVQT
ncbi:hypothetical protein BC829DRAFT_134952 [Chytridium lagenaria]|nr:hypothetical protein BC829DRAFT_134952 [Chytridium lagenaria]